VQYEAQKLLTVQPLCITWPSRWWTHKPRSKRAWLQLASFLYGNPEEYRASGCFYKRSGSCISTIGEQQISASSELAWHPLDVWMLLTLQQHEISEKTLTLISPWSQLAEMGPTTYCQTTAIDSIAAATKSSARCCCDRHFQGCFNFNFKLEQAEALHADFMQAKQGPLQPSCQHDIFLLSH
jgi:hypothetical protein